MSAEFDMSRTRENLMRAFAGETQAVMRYEFAAQTARQQKFHAIARLFEYTAEQEKQHARVFYQHLQEYGEANIPISGDFPVDTADNVPDLLSESAAHELHEANDVYPSFAQTARGEGFEPIAAHFENIASIERSHAERFFAFEALFREGKLFLAEEDERWVCLNCGFIWEGTEPPESGPVCGTERGNYVRLSQTL